MLDMKEVPKRNICTLYSVLECSSSKENHEHFNQPQFANIAPIGAPHTFASRYSPVEIRPDSPNASENVINPKIAAVTVKDECPKAGQDSGVFDGELILDTALESTAICDIKEEKADEMLIPETVTARTDDVKTFPCWKEFSENELLYHRFKYKTFSVEEVREMFQGVKDPKKCPLCPKRIKGLTSFVIHYSKHTGEKSQKCKLCDFESFYPATLIAHVETRHPDAKPHKCEECGLTFQRKGGLFKHQKLLKHFKHRLCEFCAKQFRYPHELENHVRQVHNGERSFKCDKCEMSFFRKSKLNGHMLTHSEAKNFECGDCKAKFKTKSSLNVHVRRVHNGEKYPKSKEKRRMPKHLCVICGHMFASKYKLNRHSYTHFPDSAKPFVCDICGRGFTQKVQLSEHAALHSGEAPYSCDFCGKKFRSKRTLKDHITVKHDSTSCHSPRDGVAFPCLHCPKKFPTKGRLNAHLLAHNGKWKCEFCSKTFATAQSLKTHFKTCKVKLEYELNLNATQHNSAVENSSGKPCNASESHPTGEISSNSVNPATQVSPAQVRVRVLLQC